MTDSIDRLYKAILAAKDLDPAASRTARLLRRGQTKMAKKLAEEAVEVVIEAMQGDREGLVRESADLIYNLAVLWAACGVRPQDVWAEMERRERMLGIAEKLPKSQVPAKQSAKAGPDVAKSASTAGVRRGVIALDSRRARKRR